MKTKFDKNVEWLRPFFKVAKGLVPLHRVERVSGFKVELCKQSHYEARIMTNDRHKFTIALRTHSTAIDTLGAGKFKAVKHRKRLAYDILVAFAHELAHVKQWDHSPDHWELEDKICARFRAVLREMGVKDVAVRKTFSRRVK